MVVGKWHMNAMIGGQLTGILNMSMPLTKVCARARMAEVVSDHSNHGMRSNGIPKVYALSMEAHLMNSTKELLSSSTKVHQSYSRQTKRRPYIAKAYIRWLGASIRLTGITGMWVGGGALTASGRSGRGDLPFRFGGGVPRTAGVCRTLPGVEG